MIARSPRCSAPVSSSRIAVDLPDPVAPISLKCLVSSSRRNLDAGERDAAGGGDLGTLERDQHSPALVRILGITLSRQKYPGRIAHEQEGAGVE